MSDNPDKSDDRAEEVVILVHGTFASDAADEGDRWWQKGSFFYTELSKRLPEHIRLVEPGEIFRWDGENSLIRRFAAAVKLVDVLLDHEARGVPYHVVAHSHGGSVAWLAIVLANSPVRPPARRSFREIFTKRAKSPPLPGLRGLTTVGTPFILLRKLKYLESLRPIVYLFASFFALAVIMVLDGFQKPAPGWIATVVFMNLMFAVFKAFGDFASDFALSGLNHGQSKAGWLAATYGSRWCGIWAKDDEAISLLRSAMKISKIRTRHTVPAELLLRDFWPNPLMGWVFGLYSYPARLTRRVLRRVYLPFLDRALKKRLTSFILGVDDLGSVEAVAPWPHLSLERESVLPPEVQAELKAQCDAVLAASSSGARPALKHLSLGAVEEAMKAFGDTNKAMIHNSYFDHPAVIDIIAAKIRGET